MTNPYKPPSSNIKIDENNTDNRIGWKMFFLLMLLLQIASVYLVFNDIMKDDYDYFDILDLFIYPFILLALFGYAFKKAFFQQLVWKIFFTISLIIDALFLFFEFSTTPELTDNLIVISIAFAILTPLFLLQYLALYRYGFTKKEPWDQ